MPCVVDPDLLRGLGHGNGFAGLEARGRAALAIGLELGEADGAIVYRTDIGASPKVEAVAIPDAYNVDAAYLIAPLRGGHNPAAGAAFVAFVRGDGSRSLTDRGFTIPPR